MLYIDKATILKFDLEMLKKHRRAIQFIAVLLFIVGLLCISFPFVSGDILSTVVGALLICSGMSGYSATAVIISGRYYPVSSSQSPIYWSAISSSAHRSWAFLPLRHLLPVCSVLQGLFAWWVGIVSVQWKAAGYSSLLVCWYRHCLDIPWCNADGVCNAGFHTGGNWTDI